jgi:NADH-quinone oxidoreductase subunit G
VEDLLAAFKLARDGLDARRVYVSGRAPGAADHLLLRADRNPNRTALEWIAKAFGFELLPFEALVRGLDAGSIKAVWAVGSEMPTDPQVFASLLEPLDAVVVQSFNLGPVAGRAQVLLPSSPHSEDHGTLVNFEGHLQRFIGAYPPRGQSRPQWSWAGMLLAELGAPVTWTGARDVFRELAPQVPELGAFDWDKAPRFLKHPQGLWAMPAAADGRPAGFRERSLP